MQFDRKRLLEVLERRIKEQQGFKSKINITENAKLVLNRDLHYIFKGKRMRKPGEAPKFLGNYERICPSPFSEMLLSSLKGYKENGY